MAIGDITKAAIDTLEIDASLGDTPAVLHISGSVYAVAYKGPGNDGWIKTFSCSNEGILGVTIIASLEYDGTYGLSPQLVHISGTTYAIAYTSASGSYNAPAIRTLTISDDGLTISLIDVWVPDSSFGSGTGLITHVSGTIYAFSYSREVAPAGAKLITLAIATDGTITKSAIDSLDLGSVSMPQPLFLKRAVGDYFLMCGILLHPGIAYTVEISSAGAIADAVTSTYTFATDVSAISIVELDPGYYCVAYQGNPGGGGNITTFSVGAAGDISTEIDRQKYDTNGWDPMITTLSDTMRAIVFRGDGQADGTIHTWEVSDVGVIAAEYQDEWAFNAVWGSNPFIIHVSGSVWMVVYQRVNGGAMEALTFGIRTAVVYPKDDVARVSGVVHRYDRRKGIYQLELSLGDTTSVLILPYSGTAKRATVTKQEDQDVDPIVEEAVRGAMERFRDMSKRRELYMPMSSAKMTFSGVEPGKTVFTTQELLDAILTSPFEKKKK